MTAGPSRASSRSAAAGPMGWVARHAGAVVLAALAATAALAVPMLVAAPDELASQEPPGAAFDARDAIEGRFGAGSEDWFFVVEARDGQVLDREALLALHRRLTALRGDASLGGLLVERSAPQGDGRLAGVASLADLVDAELARAGRGGLAGADDAVVAEVASRLVDEHGPRRLGLSTHAQRDGETGRWAAPALTLAITGDAQRIEGRGARSSLGSDVAVEEVGRDVQAVLRDTEVLEVTGVAIDQGLTAQEQGEAAGPFIGMTVLLIVLLVGLAFRSYHVLAVVGAALVALLVWLLGLSNLLGLKEDQILATVVPIAMIAFGVDYAFHAVGRYREERRAADGPRAALAGGLTHVAPALALALTTGALAFLANTASDIEAIAQFGVGAAVALAAAFVVLGVVVPAALVLVDERVPAAEPERRARPLIGGLAAAATATTAVLLVVFIAPAAGIAVLAAYVVAFVVVPVWVAARRAGRPGTPATPPSAATGRLASALGTVVVAVAARRGLVLPAVALLTIGIGTQAVQIGASFDVEDFFSPDTDFVVGLDLLDEHVGDQGGEPAEVLVIADLDDPAAVAAIAGFADRVADLDTPLLARDDDGRVAVDRRALDALTAPDALDETELTRVLAPADGSGLAAARLGVGLVGSRAQEHVEAARDLLEPVVADLDAQLSALDPRAEATLTGPPIVRQASLEGVASSLRTSLPIAVLLCLLCVALWLRSVRDAVVSLVPILLVVTWLYGLMHLAGFSVNLVTATIGAISIGIGIDFATHMTVRYREELARRPEPMTALRAATEGTGTALVGSAASSVAGFAVLAFAPMPMFASFGLLTALMIVLALTATLLVLPGLLVLGGPTPTARCTEAASVPRPSGHLVAGDRTREARHV